MEKNAKIAITSVGILVLVVAAYFLLQGKINPQPAALSNMNPQENQTSSSSYDIQGMKVEVLQQGTGDEAKAWDTVTVDYVGTLQDGTKFDSSIDRGQPFSFTLGQNRVIQGWELGVLGMKVGEKRRLTIPPELGYGEAGAPPVIPGNATLIFEVTMLGISPQQGK